MTSLRNEKLIAARKNRNLLQEQVASAVGISTRHYRNIEAGTCKPNVETAISIAELLKCKVSDLFGPSRRQPGEDSTHTDSTTPLLDTEETVIAAVDLSEMRTGDVVKGALDLSDGSADTEHGKKLLDLTRKVVGDAA